MIPEIKHAPTRADYLEFADYMAEDEPQSITIGPAMLMELAETAQIRLDVGREVVADESMLDWQKICEECKPIPDALRLETEAERRRNTGRALEILGHAIEYLTDQYVERHCYDRGDLEAIELLMERNRAVYFACPRTPTMWERMKARMKW